jgi:iron complex outermembrane receptor protein
MVWETYKATKDTVPINADNYRRFEEDNAAGYVRADATFFKDLLVVGGVRWEKRKIDAKAANWAQATTRLITANTEYSNWYPSVTLRYTPTRNWVIRAGASRTVGDPDYSELVPAFTASTTPVSNDAVLTVPAMNLKPYYVNNYDISVEYYFNKTGVVGGSLFRKDVSGFIINRTAPLTDPIIAQAVSDYGITASDLGTTVNGTGRINGLSSKINGIELWYNQNLSFLPKPFDGLNFQLNYTWVDINAGDLDTLYAQYQDAVTRAVNGRLSYRWRKLQTAFSVNWTGETLTATAVNTINVNQADGSRKAVNVLNQYKAPETMAKFEITYAFNPKYIGFFEIDNIGYQRKDFFKNAQPLPEGSKTIAIPATRYNYGDPVLRLGVKGSF